MPGVCAMEANQEKVYALVAAVLLWTALCNGVLADDGEITYEKHAALYA